MRRYKRFRYGPGFVRPWRPFRYFWLIGFIMMFFWWRWWPGILVLIGLSVVFGSLFRDETRQWPQNPPPPPFDPMPHPAAPTPAPVPLTPIHRSELLPATCPRCGGPIRAYEVKWTGAQSAACPYCGSNLPMKKQ